ncbi:mannitol dehydrogenase family protein [Ruegeria meonggei]|uniref:Mannitol 2-dehydrogenase n=1 Tax=Ruegeria meonggei TaxID=1446476 RepID=A0A1X7A965_9RHOB|nr:mannitol dehydrogenase family protein [Ruegeria meonggei]SLN73681.1 Mannitol 2-dehydrogenase [Ruegeria meonggei]
MDELIPLSNATLDQLPIEHPQYDRTRLTPGIVHIGVGNFHRAHQAWYLHRLMQAGEAHDWAIIGAGVRAYDAVMREKLLAQDCLTTLVQIERDSTFAEVIGPMIDYLPIEESNGPLIAAMADPAIRIVAMTVTEGGYFIDPATKQFSSNHPDIVHDVEYPAKPRTAFGAMVAALRLRREAGHTPFTGLSCDNLQGNGTVLKQTVVSLARLTDPDLADWIQNYVSFPNSMVDCIAPAVGPNELNLVHELGVSDAAPVTHEAFRQWVIEDDFCNGRPDWDHAGATFSNNVHAYENMKIRMLNAGHQVIANAGELLGISTIAECMAQPLIAGFFRNIQITEIAPTVAPVPELTALEYYELIEKRFSNPRIVDTTRRVAFDGSSRHSGFVLPIVWDQLAEGRSVRGLALVEALWARMCLGTREDGSEILPNDPFWDKLNATAHKATTRPAAWLEQTTFYGGLCSERKFVEEFEFWMNFIREQGCIAALTEYQNN